VTHLEGHLGRVGSESAAADVWHARITGSAPDVSALSAVERERLGRFKDRAAASRFAATRTLVRRVLGGALGQAPGDVRITQTDLGKPVVAGGVHFNVSHSGDLIVLAVSGDRAVGIDIERRREVQRTDALVRRWLTDPERADVERRVAQGLSSSDAFLHVWSLKEARLKALGVGIAGSPAANLAETAAFPLDELLGQLSPVGGAPEYIGAVAFA